MDTMNTRRGRRFYIMRGGFLALTLLCVLPAGEVLARFSLADDALWTADQPCDQARAQAEHSSDDPDVLLMLGLCARGDRRIERSVGFLLRGLEIDPKSEDLLTALTWIIREDPSGGGVDAVTLQRHRRTLYEIAENAVDKNRALTFMYEAAVATGDRDDAASIRDQARRDLGLDAVDYSPENREDSLRAVCDDGVFVFDLEDACIAALEMLARAAADAGTAIPDDVLGQIQETARKLFQRRKWKSGPKTAAGERLTAILDTHPIAARSSEHYRAYAATQATWRDRIAALRRAVELDIGNRRARCALGGALAQTGAQDDAWEIFAGLAAEGDRTCNAGQVLLYLELGTSPRRESLDDPPKVFYH